MDKAMTDRNYAAALWNAAEEAIKAAQEDKGLVAFEPVNWARARACRVLKFNDYSSEGDNYGKAWAIEITDADPRAEGFRAFIREWLSTHGFPDVEVRTEW